MKSEKEMTFEERKQTWLEISVIDEAEFDAKWKFQKERQSLVPQLGDVAPDFEIDVLDKNRNRTGKTVHLASLRGKPVALLFGSYTWPPFRKQTVRLNEIYHMYKDDVQFFCIYTREAHPADGWQVHDNLDESIIVPEPKTDGERKEVALRCQVNLDIQMPMLIDSIDNEVEAKYISLPMRLFVIDPEGSIAYTGGQGPRNFDSDSWEVVIKEQISNQAT